MVDIPDTLRCLFSAKLRRRGEDYVIEVPREEIHRDALSPGNAYRVAVLERREQGEASPPAEEDGTVRGAPDRPPVVEGDVRDVTIETTGDQGDGIAKVDRGYVVIVPGAEPGEEVSVEITAVHENFAIGQRNLG